MFKTALNLFPPPGASVPGFGMDLPLHQLVRNLIYYYFVFPPRGGQGYKVTKPARGRPGIKKKRSYLPTSQPTPGVFSGQRAVNAAHLLGWL